MSRMSRTTCSTLALVLAAPLAACAHSRADSVKPSADYVGPGNGSFDTTPPDERGEGYGTPGVTGSAGSSSGGPGGGISGGPTGSGSTGGAGSVGGDLPGDPGGPQSATTGTGNGTTGTSSTVGPAPRGGDRPGNPVTPAPKN